MGHTSKWQWQFGMQWRNVFWRWKVTSDYDDVSTKLMIIFMIELGIWVFAWYGMILYGIALHGTELFCIVWHGIVLCCLLLHYIALHCFDFQLVN